MSSTRHRKMAFLLFFFFSCFSTIRGMCLRHRSAVKKQGLENLSEPLISEPGESSVPLAANMYVVQRLGGQVSILTSDGSEFLLTEQQFNQLHSNVLNERKTLNRIDQRTKERITLDKAVLERLIALTAPEVDQQKLLASYKVDEIYAIIRAFHDLKLDDDLKCELAYRFFELLPGAPWTLFAQHFSIINRLSKNYVEAKTILADCLWQLLCPQLLHTLTEHTGGIGVDGIAYKDKVITGSADHTAKIWDAGTGQCLHTLSGHTGKILWIRSALDGAMIATASDDKTAKIWSGETGQCIHTLTGHTAAVCAILWSHNEERLATGSNDHTVKIWDVGTGQCLRTIPDYVGSDCNQAIDWSNDDYRLAISCNDHTVKVWDVGADQCICMLSGHTDLVRWVRWEPGSNTILASSAENDATKIWNVETEQCLQTLIGEDARWSKLGTLATTTDDYEVKIWNTETYKNLHTFKGSGVFWLPGRITSAVGSDNNRAIKICDAETGRCRHILKGHTDQISYVGWFNCGAKLVTTSWDKTAKIWGFPSLSVPQQLLVLKMILGKHKPLPFEQCPALKECYESLPSDIKDQVSRKIRRLCCYGKKFLV